MARTQARLGAARLGATRLGDYAPTVTLHIDSLASWRHGAVQGVLVDPSLTISEAEGSVPSTASFELRDATSPPQQGQYVYIGLGSADHRIFAGQIHRVRQTQSRYVEQPTWHVQCEDTHRLLDRRLVTARFESTDAGQIIAALVSSFATGFTAVPIGALGTVDEIEFTRERVSRAIDRVMNRVGGRWRLSPRFEVRAWIGSEPGQSPAAAIVATGKHWKWEHERDASQVRTRIFVRGGSHTIPATDGIVFGQFETAGGTHYFANGVSTIAVGPSSAGERYYGVSSFATIVGSPGMGRVYLSAGGFPTQAVTGGGTATVFAVVESTTLQNAVAAIEGGDGIHEHIVSDGRFSESGAIERGRAELTLFGSIEHRGSYVTRDPSAQVGRLIAVNVASPTHISSVSARIQRVSISGFEQSKRPWRSDRTHIFPQRTVTYSSGVVRDVYEILGDFERDGS